LKESNLNDLGGIVPLKSPMSLNAVYEFYYTHD